MLPKFASCFATPGSVLIDCESGTSRFQPEEGPFRGLLRDCTTSPINRLQHYSRAAAAASSNHSLCVSYKIRFTVSRPGRGGALCNWSSIHSDGFIPRLASDQLRTLDSHQLTANVALSSRTCLLFKLEFIGINVPSLIFLPVCYRF